MPRLLCRGASSYPFKKVELQKSYPFTVQGIENLNPNHIPNHPARRAAAATYGVQTLFLEFEVLQGKSSTIQSSVSV